jgi:hypothetical protein
MPKEHRLTIRLPQDLYTQLAACGWSGQPLAAIVRHALQEYVARQREQPRSADETAVTVAAMAARLDGLQDQVESLATRLEGLAASTRQTTAAMADTSARIRQPVAATAADTPAPRRQSGRPSGPLRQQILDVLQAHPAGLRADEIRVHMQAQRPIGDTLAGMVRGGVITAQGRGAQRRYVVAA